MPLDYDLIKNWEFPQVPQNYTSKDSMLYALGVGFGQDPMDEQQLRFVYEKDQLAVPSMACVLGHPGAWFMNPKAKLDWVKIVHGEQDLRIFKPLKPAASIYSKSRIISCIDKGVDKGALIWLQRDVHDAETHEVVASQFQGTFARGDGGFGKSDPAPTVLPAVPEGAPDAVCDLPTYAHQALVYRLSADPNPLHAEPGVAKKAGFPRPILHGLATYGVACHAVLKTCCDYDPTRLKRYGLRFSSPVYPGETIRTEMWKRGNSVHFRSRVLERDIVVLNNGIAELA